MALAPPQLKNEFLRMYLEYVEETESPRIFHMWAAIAGAGACLGRRVTFPFGLSDIFANQYVLLVGPPGVRKSTAANIMKRLIQNATGVRFAPDDTSGQRQGLIASIRGEEENADIETGILKAADAASITIEDLGKVQMNLDMRDRHTMFALASEFNSFIGNNAPEILPFLTKAYDGEDYDYRLKNSRMTLKDPLLSILGCTTPTNITTAFPPAAIGQGFMSRIVLVFANQKYKNVPRPRPLPERLAKELEKIFNYLFFEADGPIMESTEAAKTIDDLYNVEVKINDPRFVYYIERRHTHLIKLSMILAAVRRSRVVEKQDLIEANEILTQTEKTMPDALGEFGLSPIAAAKQKMIEFLQHVKGPVSENILWAVMARDMKRIDFMNSIFDLTNAGKIRELSSATQGRILMYNSDKFNAIDSAINALTAGDDENDGRSNDQTVISGPWKS